MSKAARKKRRREAAEAAATAAPGVAEVTPALASPAWKEFTTRLNELAVAHSFAVRGLPPQGEDLVQFAARAGGDLDKPMWIIPSGPWGSKLPSYWEMRQRDLPSFLAPAGPVAISLGHQWAVAVFTEWDVTYRKWIAAERGVEDKEVIVPALGDLRRFRNDIVHHRGIAKADESGKVEVFTDWFTLGQPIFIGEHQIVAFMDKLGLVKWEDQGTSDEIKGMIDAYEAEKVRRGGRGDFTLHRDDIQAAAALANVVQCVVCKQRSTIDELSEAKVCPKCGGSLIKS